MKRMIDHIEKLLGHHENVLIVNPYYNTPDKGLKMASEMLADAEDSQTMAWLFTPQAGPAKKQAKDSVIDLLKNNTLRACLTLPKDFSKVSQSSVSVELLIFELRRPHEKDDEVLFIDASVDGYKRTNRNNETLIQDIDHGVERWQEIQGIISGTAPENDRVFYTEKADTVITDTIEISEDKAGEDWMHMAHVHIDITPTKEDFEKTVEEYLLWRFNSLLYQGIK